MIEFLVLFFFTVGLLFNFLGVLGLFRFPDVFTRLHAATKCTTFGSIFTTLAVVSYEVYLIMNGQAQDLVLTLHEIIAVCALVFTNPTGAHALARAAYRSGVKPYKLVVDDLAKHRRVRH